MNLDRSSIEKRDFPTGRRGYDPAAVDAHLRAIADEVEALRAGAVPSTAAAASERVGAIVAAAEATAADIERAAREEADRIRADAASGSRAEVEALRGTVTGLRDRAEALDREVAGLLDRVAALAGATGSAASQPAAPVEAVEAPLNGEVRPPEPPAPEPAAPGPAASEPATPDAADVEGARLVALSMALGGTPRDETDRYLAEHYARLPDRAALLDEVYATVAGG